MDAGQGNPWDAPEDGPTPEPAPVPVAAHIAAAADGPSTAAPGPESAPAAAPPADGDPGDAETVEPPPDDADPNRNKVVLIALGAFVVIALVGFLLSRHGSSDPSTPAGGTTTVSTVAGGSTPAGGSVGANGGQTVSIIGTVDGFARADSATSLGALPNGTKWKVQTGSWGIAGGSAYVVNPDPKHRNIAFIPTGFASGQVQVRITTMEPQAGIVFRYGGPCSYWAVESSPKVASWNIVKVAKCKATPMGNTGYSPVGAGVTVGVVFTDTSISVVVNGKIVKTIDNADLAGSGKVGLAVAGVDAGKVRFDDFTAGGPKGQGVVNVKPKPGASGSKSTTTTAPK